MKARMAVVAIAAAGGVLTALPSPALAAVGELTWSMEDSREILVHHSVHDPVAGRCYTIGQLGENDRSRTGVVTNNTNSDAIVYDDLNCTTPHPYTALLPRGRSATAAGSVRFLN